MKKLEGRRKKVEVKTAPAESISAPPGNVAAATGVPVPASLGKVAAAVPAAGDENKTAASTLPHLPTPVRRWDQARLSRGYLPESSSSESSTLCDLSSKFVPLPSTFQRVSRRLTAAQRAARPPEIASFAQFLSEHARVKSGSSYAPYHFAGRELLREIVAQIDDILDQNIPDVSIALCGGAQFGKTVLMLNLLAYLVAVRFRNVGYYLPDDDLVSGLVDGKLRPDVLDQIPWLARAIAVGKTLAPSGRAVHRKGAFLCTDGQRTALAWLRGLGKIPTSFSMDVVIQDEKDDLPEHRAKFLSGRMTASDLRLSLIIGTQRYHGAGQNLAFTEGTQHIGLLPCPGCGARHNPETLWPGICRLVVPGIDPSQYPHLTPEGNFAIKLEGRSKKVEVKAVSPAVFSGDVPCSTSSFSLPTSTFPYSPGQHYLLACPACGAELDRHAAQWHPLAPERAAQRRFSYRISQLLIAEIDLAQIVAAWQLALRDPVQMTVFCTDRLALPKSTTQALTPHHLEQARAEYTLGVSISASVGKVAAAVPAADANRTDRRWDSDGYFAKTPLSAPSSFSLPTSNFLTGGLDLGDQCWFVAREISGDHVRLVWIEPIAAERVRVRVPELFHHLGLRALCVDAGPLRDLSRDLAFILNDLRDDAMPSSDDPAALISFSRDGHPISPDGAPLRWHGPTQTWHHLRCATVEFTQREGQGLRQKLGRTQDGRCYPLLAAHRDETIAQVVQELLPPDLHHPRLAESADGTAVPLAAPRFQLPRATEETRAVLDLYERHLLTGSRQERIGKTLRYLDQCENHFLLATAYAALAERIAPPPVAAAPHHVPAIRPCGPRRIHRTLEGA